MVRGLAHLGGGIVVAVKGGPGVPEGTELLFVAAPGGSATVHRAVLDGDYRLHPGADGVVWVVRNDLDPEVLKLPGSALEALITGAR